MDTRSTLVPHLRPRLTFPDHLPALFHDGTWTSGYRDIVGYLVGKSLCRDLDAGLDAAQRADSVAYAAYLSAHAAPLLDLSLYASAANWAAATRPAYSALLPFPLTWTVPTLIRADALARVQHLGLAELDTDFDPSAGLHLSAGRDALPETFRRHLPPLRARKTIREEMTPEQAVAIRLFGLAEDCFSVLASLMGAAGSDGEAHPRFFAATPVSSLDCLAYGYLALMARPQVPRPFLRDCLQAETPRLCLFVDDLDPPAAALPWAPPEPPALLAAGARALDSALRHVPGVGAHYAAEMRRRAETGADGVDGRALVLVTGLASAAAALGYGLHAYRAMQPFGAAAQAWRACRPASRLSQFGELGAMLSSAMGSYEAPPPPGAVPAGSGRLVQVDSELD